MNKLIIIGNGFDKAHGLPTSYTDFINDFWKELKSNFEDENIKKFVHFDKNYSGIFDMGKISCYNDLKNNLLAYSGKHNLDYNMSNHVCKERTTRNIIFEFKNNFFKQLNKKQSLQKWVDIENEYYYQLKKIAKITNQNSETKRTLVKELNEEFEQVKKMLEKYLSDKVIEIYGFGKNSVRDPFFKFYYILKPISVFNNEDSLLEEFSIQEDKDDIVKLFKEEKEDVMAPRKAKTLLLNFNYTPTSNQYFKILKNDINIEQILIHGQVNAVKNPINFGFGDEMDGDYKFIESLNDNEFLKNFKSFQYLQNSNYNKLLSYVDSGKFQVYVLGHSCGLSDRTLLNTVFEHKYCCSIKVFYHEKKDKDNYTDIIQNISRHFDDKQKMRRLVVNKTLCQPLPQIQLAKKV